VVAYPSNSQNAWSSSRSELVCSMNHDLLGEMATIGHDVLAARLGAATRCWLIAIETNAQVVSGVTASAERGRSSCVDVKVVVVARPVGQRDRLDPGPSRSDLQMHGDDIEPYAHWTQVTRAPSNA
jgi:hypothetical protein